MIKDKMLGCLYGQAIGNALGLLTEFMSKDQVASHFSPMLRYYNQNNQNGYGVWEDDDTKQMLCILDEFVTSKAITASGLAANLLNWLKTDGRGCGNLVYQVLTHPDYLTNPISVAHDRWQLSHCESAPNGALMRTSVVGLWPKNVEQNTVLACRVTHSDPRCVGSCVIATAIIYNLVWKNHSLSYSDILDIAHQYDDRIAEWVKLAYESEDISVLDLENRSGMGYTLRTLAAALWCYWHADSFEDGLLAVVNEGGDADTNGAIACAILGAKYGYNAIPRYYIENLHNEGEYRQKVDGFIALAIKEKK